MNAHHEWCMIVPGSSTIIDVLLDDGLTWINRETPEQVAERYPGAVRVKLEEWIEERAKNQDRPGEWVPCTERAFDNGLGALPPAAWGIHAHLVGEPCDHHARTGEPRYTARRQRGDVFEEFSRPVTVCEFRALCGG